MPLGTLLDVDMWGAMMFEEGFDFQATMFQPVGGMDRIPMAFAKQARRRWCASQSEVTAIKRRNDGVSIAYTDKRSGKRSVVEAAYCLVTIPLKVLEPIDHDFAAPHRARDPRHRLRQRHQDRLAVARGSGRRRTTSTAAFPG